MFCRTLRKPFFSPAHEPHDACLRIAEDPANAGSRPKSREGVLIDQPSPLPHPRIVPSFRIAASPATP
jgi:hypothetical protein